jgi:hypothetical protein
MSVGIYLSIAAGLALGWLIKERRLRKYSEACLSVLIYSLVFLVGAGSGSIELPLTSSTYSALTTTKIAFLVGTLATLPTFLSMLLAVVLLGMRHE